MTEGVRGDTACREAGSPLAAHTWAAGGWVTSTRTCLQVKRQKHLPRGPQTSSTGVGIAAHAPQLRGLSPGAPALRFPGAAGSLSAPRLCLPEGTSILTSRSLRSQGAFPMLWRRPSLFRP